MLDYDYWVCRYDEDPISGGIGSFLGLAKKSYSGKPFEWIHFYGADPQVKSGTRAARFLTKFPEYGSAYRGSALVSMRVIKYPTGQEIAHKTPMNYDIPENLMPKGGKYLLRLLAYQGSDLGSFGHHASGRGPMYALRITLGPHTYCTRFQQYEDGAVDWAEILEGMDLPLPLDLPMLPDIFITLLRGTESSSQPEAFVRIKPLKIMPQGLANPTEWYQLKHDMSHKSTPPSSYPGSILIKIALVNMQDLDVSDIS